MRFGDGTVSVHEHGMQVLGLNVRTAIVMPSFTTLMSMLPGSDFVATVPERFASRFAAAIGVVTLQRGIQDHPVDEGIAKGIL